MILEKNYILNNLKDKYFNENWIYKVYKVNKNDIIYIYDNFDIIKRIRKIDYFMNNDWIEYKARKSFYFTIDNNWNIAFLKKRIRNSHLYIDIDWLYFDNFIKYFWY